MASQNSKMRLFPVTLGVAAYIFLRVLAYFRRTSIIASLDCFTLTITLFLLLITVFYELNKHSEWIKRSIFVVIVNFFKNSINKVFRLKLRQAQPPEQLGIEPLEAAGQSANDTDLIEIKKETHSEQVQAGVSLDKRIYAGLFIAGFLGLAFWRIKELFKIMPLTFVSSYRGSIIDAVLLLVFPSIAVLYLKMRNEGLHPTDKISRDILKLFSYISFAFAAVIAAAAALNLNILTVLQWVHYAATAYVVVALAINIALSMLKGDIFNFDYTLFPKIRRTKDTPGEFADSETAQWKVSLKSLYTIKYTLRILPGLALGLIVILFLSTSIFTVQPHQQAAVYRFGILTPSSIKDAGFHFKFPWPIDKAEIFDVHRAVGMQIGYESSGTADFLWTQKHDGGEYMLLLGNGNEMVAANLKVMYVISDLYLYIKTCTKPEVVLSAAAYNALMKRTINTTLDSFLSVDRNSLSVSVLDELSEFCESEKLGFSVVQVIIESIHPPVDIADVYQKVVSASIDKTTVITRAHINGEKRIMDAIKQSKTIVDEAKAMQFSRVSDAQKEAAVYYAATEAFRISPGSYELTKRLDVDEKLINGNKVYVFSRGAENGISQFVIGKASVLNVLDAKGEGNE